MLYSRLISAALREPWAVTEDILGVIGDLLALRAAGGRLTPDEIRARIGSPAPAAVPRRVGGAGRGAIGVIPVHGVIANRTFEASSGMTSAETLKGQLRAFAGDPDIATIVLDINSPGGAVSGVPELAAEIYDTRRQKPVVAIANSLAASAGYWIGAMATEFVVVPSGDVGSIGVYAVHENWSGYFERQGIEITAIQAGNRKLEGAPWQPLDEEARAHYQRRVDEAYVQFTRDVARGRGVTVATVQGEPFGQGRVFGARDALRRGLVDRIETFDLMLERISTSPPRRRPARERAMDAHVDVTTSATIADLRRRADRGELDDETAALVLQLELMEMQAAITDPEHTR